MRVEPPRAGAGVDGRAGVAGAAGAVAAGAGGGETRATPMPWPTASCASCARRTAWCIAAAWCATVAASGFGLFTSVVSA